LQNLFEIPPRSSLQEIAQLCALKFPTLKPIFSHFNNRKSLGISSELIFLVVIFHVFSVLRRGGRKIENDLRMSFCFTSSNLRLPSNHSQPSYTTSHNAVLVGGGVDYVNKLHILLHRVRRLSGIHKKLKEKRQLLTQIVRGRLDGDPKILQKIASTMKGLRKGVDMARLRLLGCNDGLLVAYLISETEERRVEEEVRRKIEQLVRGIVHLHNQIEASMKRRMEVVGSSSVVGVDIISNLSLVRSGVGRCDSTFMKGTGQALERVLTGSWLTNYKETFI